MSSNKKAKRKLILRYGEVCFLEELGIRKKEDVEKELSRYSGKQRRILDKLTYHHIVDKFKGRYSNRRKWGVTKKYQPSMV